MSNNWLRGGFVLLMVVAGATMGGCGKRAAVGPADGAPEDTTTRLADAIEHSPADWLKLPRAKLAEMVREWDERVRKQQEHARTNPQSVEWLPQLRPPVGAPVLREATFSARAGFSLPPYARPGEKDAGLALHLARHGDREAALRLADPDDHDLLARIDSFRAGRNYPVEWTQLVGLAQQSAEIKLAHGGEEGPEGAAELVVLHRRLKEVLDAKAAAGPLGATLLPAGRRALTLAAAALREPRWNKTGLAQDIDAALAAWGEVPAAAPALRPGASRADVARVFPGGRGPTLLAHDPQAIRRVTDLLSLPVPAEGVRGVVAFLDDKENLNNLLVLYRCKINELYPEPVHLAYRLTDHGAADRGPADAPGILARAYESGGLVYDVSLLTRGQAVGALVRVGAAGGAPTAPAFSRDPRDFGAVHLDRSFEENRQEVEPRKNTNPLVIDRKESLARVGNPAGDAEPDAALLQREPAADLVAALTLRWPAGLNPLALEKLVLPLLAAYGDARIAGTEDSAGGHLDFTWADARTRVRLRLPYDGQSPELRVEDARGADGLKARAEAADRFDRDRRQARREAGRLRTRLARSLAALDGVELGMSRADALAALPRDPQAIRRRQLPDGVNLLFLGEPPADAVYHARQAFVRFRGKKVAEVRVRFQVGLRAATPKNPTLLDTLRRGPAGAPQQLPAPWARLWPDLAARKPAPVLYRWQDDHTVLTYQRDAGGSELVLRDRPLEGDEDGLPPLEFCDRGVEGCSLGDGRAAVLRRWKVGEPLRANGAEVLGMPDSSPYDLLLVWYQDGKVSRVTARHRGPQPLRPADAGAALQEAWSRDIDHLGYIRREDGPQGKTLQSFGWHDDRTRVRVFVQEMDEGPRLFTEWRDWPLPTRDVAAGR